TLGRAPTDSGAVARLLERYRSIVAVSFASAKAADSTRAMRPTRRLALRDARGALLVALSLDSTSGGYIVRRTGGPASGGQPAARRGDGAAPGTAVVRGDDPALRRRGDLREDRRERARPGRLHHPADQPPGGEPPRAAVPDRRGAAGERGADHGGAAVFRLR